MEPKDIITAAWRNSGLSQVKFALLIGKSQPMLSKYMSGFAIPPSDVLILCMNKCGMIEQRDVSAQKLADRIVKELSGATYAGARTAINQIIDSISRGNDTIAHR